MRLRKSDIVFDIICYGFLALVAVAMLYPFLNVLAVSVSDYYSYLQNPFMIWPENITFKAFAKVFSNNLILNGYRNTLIVAVVGTFISVAVIILTAYPLTRKSLRGKALMINFILFTTYFNGGLIPTFYLIQKLGMINSLWALILPGMMPAFNVILMKNFIEGIPESLEEAARIDGASDAFVLLKIVIPLSKPIIATLSLFAAVGYWNSFFNAIIYIRDPQKWTLQVVLREIIMFASAQALQTGGNLAEMQEIPSQSLQYASLVAVILPIICVYPFMQKYFMKGMMLGAVKG